MEGRGGKRREVRLDQSVSDVETKRMEVTWTPRMIHGERQARGEHKVHCECVVPGRHEVSCRRGRNCAL